MNVYEVTYSQWEYPEGLNSGGLRVEHVLYVRARSEKKALRKVYELPFTVMKPLARVTRVAWLIGVEG